jgi:uncharacterized protein YndB with AHSA1/START domain
MKHLVAVERTSDLEITVTRQFNGPARLVFRAWSEPELFRQWWVPPSFGMTLLSCEMDVRTGGTYRLVFKHPAVEEPMAFFGRYTDVVPHSRIVWTNEESPDVVISTVTLEEQAGTTRLTMTERYPSKQALDEALANGSSGTGAAAEQFGLLDEVLVAMGVV